MLPVPSETGQRLYRLDPRIVANSLNLPDLLKALELCLNLPSEGQNRLRMLRRKHCIQVFVSFVNDPESCE
jgi:hypothetical protein